jgi:glycosyltransferase involved in cell wall biosynthesis
MSSPSNPWRLLIVVNVPWFFVMHRLPIALMARERGAEVHIACGEGEGVEDIVSLGLPFHPLPLTRRPLAPIRDLRTVWALARLYRRLRPDVVHHVTLKPVIYGSIAARFARVPAVVNAFAGLGYTFSSGSFVGRLRRSATLQLLARALRLPRQAVVFENNDDRMLLTEAGAVPAERAFVISGVGVDTTEYAPTAEPTGRVCVVLASRMLREKGVEYFVEAARRLKLAGVDARFVLVGMPDPFNPGSLTEDQLRSWDSEGVVEWQGFRRDMPRVLAEAHVVCLPTYYREGVPRILMEAAACGRPLVTTDMPGCRDIVQHGVNGLIVPPHDVDKLTAALQLLIGNRDLRLQLGLASRAIVEAQFALPKVLDQFWQLYSTLRVSAPATSLRLT